MDFFFIDIPYTHDENISTVNNQINNNQFNKSIG